MFEDRLLVRRLNTGDTQALRRIYEKYKPDLFRVAGALLSEPAAVEDVVHDVFVAFASQAGQFELRGSLKGYLAICVANRARNVVRQDRPIRPERLRQAESHRDCSEIVADSAIPSLRALPAGRRGVTAGRDERRSHGRGLGAAYSPTGMLAE